MLGRVNNNSPTMGGGYTMLVPSLRHDVPVPHHIFMTRLFDVCISSILLVITLPVMVLTAVLIYLESPGPVFGRQQRIGERGHPFALLKFRTTRIAAKADDAPHWASDNDAGSTRVGRLIRQLYIDELPQLLNVLRGELSLVGLRPSDASLPNATPVHKR